MLPASAVLLPAALPSTSSMQKGAVRFVVNDRWGQVSLSGGPGDPKSQTGRTVRNLVALFGVATLLRRKEICFVFGGSFVEFKRLLPSSSSKTRKNGLRR